MSSSTASSFICHRCSRDPPSSSATCPDCHIGNIRRRLPTPPNGPHARSPFNPVIVMRGPQENPISNPATQQAGGNGNGNGFDLYYDDGGELGLGLGLGLRPLPETISEFLIGSGFDRLLDQLAQIEINHILRPEYLPATKSSVELMPTIEIVESHLELESNCAVCKDAFELGAKVREMPCKHIYHSDCILPWLNMRNSCPVCRYEMPVGSTGHLARAVSDGENGEGLRIWRLPGGGYAVGRLPGVYTEVDGGFSSGGGVPRRVTWAGNRTSSSGGFRTSLRNFFSCFGGGNGMRVHSSRSSSNSSSSGGSSSYFGSSSRRNRRLDISSHGRSQRR